MKAKDLRSSILQMAVQGKLVAQDPADEPASALLERIRVERAKLIKEKKIKAPKGGESIIYLGSDGSRYEKRGKGEPVCIDDEIPFDIPEGWEWTRLGSLIDLLSGVDLSSVDYNDEHRGVPYLTGASNFSHGTLIENRWTERPRRESSKGDLLFTCKGTVGEMAINSFDKAHIARQIMAIRPTGDNHLPYLEAFLASLVSSIKASAKGVIPGIERATLLTALVPVPPLAEQRRIAERVSELMPLVEEYGKLEDEREALDDALPERLRKSVLQMAVEGKLVAQNPSDEPASVLLGRIREDRARLIAEKKIKAPKGGESIIYLGSDGRRYEKRGKGEPVCIDDEIPFDIPEGWEWTRLGSLIDLLSGVDLSSVDYNDEHRGVPYLTGASNFSHGTLIENRWTERPRRESSKGDLLFTCKGTVGEMAINSFDKAHIARQIMAIRPTGDNHLPYLEAFLASLVSSIKASAKGVIPGIERATLLTALVPVPPLAEQRRIAERVSELMPLVEEYGKLEDEREALDDALPERLRKSVLQMAVEGKLVAQNPSDEPASVLLGRIREDRARLIAEKKIKAPKGGESIIYLGSDGGTHRNRSITE